MFFYVDESGQTGSNLFDLTQPILFYGILSSSVDLDLVCANKIGVLCRKLGVDRLHASNLGYKGIKLVEEDMVKIHRDYHLKFDLVGLHKIDFSIIVFFDQVFDSGVNQAMTWSGYWTPLRYVLLMKIASLFDFNLCKKAWYSRINPNNKESQAGLIEVCQELLNKLPLLQDDRAQQLLGDSLIWAIKNVSELEYNSLVRSRRYKLLTLPNIVCFQPALFSIYECLKQKNIKKSSKNVLVIDQQSQFNKAQKQLAKIYETASNSEYPIWSLGPGMPILDLKRVPNIFPEIKSSSDSSGLMLVDLYLWLATKIHDEKSLPFNLNNMASYLFKTMSYREISLGALNEKWSKFFQKLPEPTEEFQAGRNLHEMEERARVKFENFFRVNNILT